MTWETFSAILVWTVTGGVAGYLASLVLKTERQGCFINIALGIIGAFVGSYLVNHLGFLSAFRDLFGTSGFAGFFNQIFHSFFGAVIVLILYELIMPGKQLGVRKEKRKSRRR